MPLLVKGRCALNAATQSNITVGRTIALATVTWLSMCGIGSGQQSASPAPQLYSHGDPTNDEQYLLTLLNRGRMDPVGEGQRLEAWLNQTPVGQSVVAQYQIDPAAVAARIAGFPAVPPLAFTADLIAAARGHSEDMAAHNGNSHIGTDGSTPDQRVAASGFTTPDGDNVFAGENFSPGANSPYMTHAGYFVDWGNPDFGHLKQSMNGDGTINVVGIGYASVAASQNDPYPLVETEDFGGPGFSVVNNKVVPTPVPAQLLGVVYTDANGNSVYDSGEGVAGATVTMDGGYYYTVTSASGGYALPLVNADGSNVTGPATVHIVLPDSSETRTATVTVSSYTGPNGPFLANIEWDAITNQPPTSAPPTETNSALPTISGGGTVQAGGKLKLTVARPANSDLTQPVTVAYKLKGTAMANVDYVPLPGTVTIPAGKATAKIKVTALDQTVPNGPSGTITLVLKLRGVAGAQGKATVTFEP